ncbi:peroxiredoxin family protein [Streptomyces sp. NPDC052236]|uniref:peroxiredoxin family protein n=1 Tax=Streptomyces sp. NPDC052236 TaxID=3365686 RepID=UPI0037D311A2
MEYLVAGLVLVAAVAAINAALTLAVMRRWRERVSTPPATAHSHGSVEPDSDPDLGIAAGARMPAFTAVTADGVTVTRDDLAGREALIAFLSLDCSGCDDSLPAFGERARELRAAGGIVLATVVGIDAAESELASRLAGIADFVVPEFLDAPVSNHFGARYYPGFAHYGADELAIAAGIGMEGLAKSAQPSAL